MSHQCMITSVLFMGNDVICYVAAIFLLHNKLAFSST